MSPGHNPGSSTALSPTRRTIAERMTTSLRHTAPVTLATTEDVTRLVELREQWKAAASTTSSVVPSYTDVLVKLCAAALSRHPTLAARWEGERLLHARAIHIGIAVDTEAGLLVPVIHNVGELGLRDIALRSRDLIERARARKLTAQELRGGVFTVTSLGSFGIEAFTPIINYPECAILGVGQVRREPWAVDDQIVLRDRVTFSLTFDHRAMDGATAARFLQGFCELVRSPAPHLELEA
jgi:pyruvate dehydrogenase E2 component (dihydrolipoamide acetyltransferase)